MSQLRLLQISKLEITENKGILPYCDMKKQSYKRDNITLKTDLGISRRTARPAVLSFQ